MTLATIVFFTVFLLSWLGLHAAVAHRLIHQGSPTPAWGRRMIWGVIVVIAVIPLVAFFGRRLEFGNQVLEWLGFLLMGVSSLLISFTLVIEIPRLLVRGWLRLRKAWRARFDVNGQASAVAAASNGRGQPLQTDAPQSPSRRAFFADIANYGIVGGAAGLSVYGFVEARRVPRVTEVEVPVAGLHPDLDGLRIVQLSDVHVGPTIRGTWLDKVVEIVNGLEPDVVALTGDFVDGFVPDLEPELAALGRIRATHGAFFVTGNHEYYWDGPAWCRAIAQLGPRVLVDEHALLEHGGAKLLVAGVPDLHAERYVPEHRSDPIKAREGAPKVDFSLLLAHQPRSVFAAAKAGFDLQLSGHTHSGQFFPMSVLIHLFHPYVKGLNRHEDMWIYVNQGTGYWGPPNRAGVPSEITCLTLRRA